MPNFGGDSFWAGEQTIEDGGCRYCLAGGSTAERRSEGGESGNRGIVDLLLLRLQLVWTGTTRRQKRRCDAKFPCVRQKARSESGNVQCPSQTLVQCTTTPQWRGLDRLDWSMGCVVLLHQGKRRDKCVRTGTRGGGLRVRVRVIGCFCGASHLCTKEKKIIGGCFHAKTNEHSAAAIPVLPMERKMVSVRKKGRKSGVVSGSSSCEKSRGGAKSQPGWPVQDRHTPHRSTLASSKMLISQARVRRE